MFWRLFLSFYRHGYSWLFLRTVSVTCCVILGADSSFFFSGEKENQRKTPLLANCSAAKRSSPACFGCACNSICLRRGGGAFYTVSSHCFCFFFSRRGYSWLFLRTVFISFFSVRVLALPLFHFFPCFSVLFLRTVIGILLSFLPFILLQTVLCAGIFIISPHCFFVLFFSCWFYFFLLMEIRTKKKSVINTWKQKNCLTSQFNKYYMTLNTF